MDEEAHKEPDSTLDQFLDDAAKELLHSTDGWLEVCKLMSTTITEMPDEYAEMNLTEWM